MQATPVFDLPSQRARSSFTCVRLEVCTRSLAPRILPNQHDNLKIQVLTYLMSSTSFTINHHLLLRLRSRKLIASERTRQRSS